MDLNKIREEAARAAEEIVEASHIGEGDILVVHHLRYWAHT